MAGLAELDAMIGTVTDDSGSECVFPMRFGCCLRRRKGRDGSCEGRIQVIMYKRPGQVSLSLVRGTYFLLRTANDRYKPGVGEALSSTQQSTPSNGGQG
jgi:hypothetical protein